MGGFFGFGQSGTEKSSLGQLNNVFNYGLDTSKSQQKAGANTLASAKGSFNDAATFFKSLLSGGRTQTAINAAPAVNAVRAQADTAKREEAATGTGRGGGTAGANREGSTTTNATIDNIINANLMGGKLEGAKGLTTEGAALGQIGSTQEQIATNLLGLGERAAEIPYQGAINKEDSQTTGLSRIISAFI